MPADPIIEFPPFRLDCAAGRLWRAAQAVPLRPKAWALLRYLAERPGLLLTKEQVHHTVWNDAIVSDGALSRTVAEVRQALGDDCRTPRIIETVHRRGWRFVAPISGTPAPSDAGPPSIPVLSAPDVSLLVGRAAELASLQAQLRRAATGRREIAFIQGEAGIGKSALVEQFLHAATRVDDFIAIGYGRSVQQFGQREPFMPVLESLDQLGRGPSRSALLSALRAVAPSWLAQLPALQAGIDDAAPRPRPAETTSHRMLREFSGVMEAFSRDRLVILVLEDLHWSDQATVDLISVLAQRSEPARLMVVGTYRPAEAVALDHPIRQVVTLLRARQRCAEMQLECLCRRDVAAYLDRRFPGSRVADVVATAVHDHGGGNPLFMASLVDHLLTKGWLLKSHRVWRLSVSQAATRREIPDNLRQLVEGHLRLVSAEQRTVLEAASVVGQTFDAPTVAEALDADAATVDSVCHGLSRSQRWLREAGTVSSLGRAVAARYAFRHALCQRALYERLPPGRRAALHERIGRISGRMSTSSNRRSDATVRPLAATG